MAIGKTFGKILKGVGKSFSPSNLNKGLDAATDQFESAKKFAKQANDLFARDLRPDELENNWSVLQHITKRKAKMSTNLVAFGGLALYGAGDAMGREANSQSMGEVSAGQMYDTTETFVSPTLNNAVNEQARNPELMSESMVKSMEHYGSAGPDLVFALHNLKNR